MAERPWIAWDLELLRLAALTRREVEIAVSECLYGCCSRPASRRTGAQHYRGIIADVDERRLILHAIALATLNYHVIAELVHLEDVRFVD